MVDGVAGSCLSAETAHHLVLDVDSCQHEGPVYKIKSESNPTLYKMAACARVSLVKTVDIVAVP